MAHFERFIHEPLDLISTAIRTVRILPGPEDAIIECSLEHTTLQGYRYVCLSYMCGSQDDTTTILVNGSSFQVYRNLRDFLIVARRLKLEDELWIDAICISQSDISERNRQVQMMSKIYSTARRVIIWPGHTSESLTLAILESAALGLGETPWFPGEKAYASLVTRSFADHRAAFLACIHLPYWNRLWILQEIFLARSRYIIIGGVLIKVIRFVNLILEADYLMNRERRSKGNLAQTSNIPCVHLIGLLNSFLRTSKPQRSLDNIDLTTVMDACKRRDCSEIKDRWYGCMSVIKSAQGFPVDYTTGAAELTLSVLQYLANQSALRLEDLISLNILADSLEVTLLSICHSCAREHSSVDIHSIPSSILDFHRPHERQPFLVVAADEKKEVKSWSGRPTISHILRSISHVLGRAIPFEIERYGRWDFCARCRNTYTLFAGHNLGSPIRIAPRQLWCQPEVLPEAASLGISW